eukprot:TRINITY_DN9797_c0_g1_i1.p1 TRINITY_DN9797_c0_g1~~TRINITY_DN9797_c0_g1_i1.p1  ORF type:complete len:193 (+),score=10.65 TRINITY_DN9797_c0_g1_i1:29-580(+)
MAAVSGRRRLRGERWRFRTSPSGWSWAGLDNDRLEHDRLANSCGEPPNVEYASTAQSGSVWSGSAAVVNACASGSSLDGSRDGYHDLGLSCLAYKWYHDFGISWLGKKSFEIAPTWFPAQCGRAPSVLNAEPTSSSQNIFSSRQILFSRRWTELHRLKYNSTWSVRQLHVMGITILGYRARHT